MAQEQTDLFLKFLDLFGNEGGRAFQILFKFLRFADRIADAHLHVLELYLVADDEQRPHLGAVLGFFLVLEVEPQPVQIFVYRIGQLLIQPMFTLKLLIWMR